MENDEIKYYFSFSEKFDEESYFTFSETLPITQIVEEISKWEDSATFGEIWNNAEEVLIYLWDGKKDYIGSFIVFREFEPVFIVYKNT